MLLWVLRDAAVSTAEAMLLLCGYACYVVVCATYTRLLGWCASASWRRKRRSIAAEQNDEDPQLLQPAHSDDMVELDGGPPTQQEVLALPPPDECELSMVSLDISLVGSANVRTGKPVNLVWRALLLPRGRALSDVLSACGAGLGCAGLAVSSRTVSGALLDTSALRTRRLRTLSTAVGGEWLDGALFGMEYGQAVMHGFLFKKSNFYSKMRMAREKWQRRWVVLTGDRLFYLAGTSGFELGRPLGGEVNVRCPTPSSVLGTLP
jgi:hypothetical protein